MCKLQCVFSFFAIFAFTTVSSWDFAVTKGSQIEFYSDKVLNSSEGGHFKDLTVLAYDAVDDILLLVDKQNESSSIIYSLSLITKKVRVIMKEVRGDIQGLAFDPVNGTLFWTDKLKKSIFWSSLESNETGHVELNNEIPRAIAVDSCGGYIYWTNVQLPKSSIKRAKFLGNINNIEEIVNADVHMPVSIAVDQRTKKLYWADDKPGIHFSIESSDLDGKNRKTLWQGIDHQPSSLTISNNDIYWIDYSFKTIWKLPKSGNYPPTEITTFSDDNKPLGIAGNYHISDQIKESPECEPLIKKSKNKSFLYESFHVADDFEVNCVHGVKEQGKLSCKCMPGYTGKRCEFSLCHNFCLRGDCFLTSDGQPNCRCNDGFEGKRCEIDGCHGYCLNGGTCLMDRQKTPTCKCMERYEGDRCESAKVIVSSSSTTTSEPIVLTSSSTKPKNFNMNEKLIVPKPLPSNMSNIDDLSSSGSSYLIWDPVRDPIIMSLGLLCLLLCVTSTLLLRKIVKLNQKPRPRIKRHIIVNRSGTPLTARPDQCEITIENCCNMNICETPCFEPRSTIRPNLLDVKPGKEEKKNLINNMELPDDF